jgi:tetratricopeptide (TPR) repeat protein
MIGLHVFEPHTANTAVARPTHDQTLFVTDRNLDQLVSAASWHLDNNNLAAATRFISAADQLGNSDATVKSLKVTQQALLQYHDGVEKIARLLADGDTDAADELLRILQSKLAQPPNAKYLAGTNRLDQFRTEIDSQRHQNQLRNDETKKAANKAANKVANKVVSADKYLDEAYAHLDNGHYDAAMQVIKQATEEGVSDDEISIVRSRLSQMRGRQHVLSDDEKLYAQHRLGELTRAIELRNLSALTMLTGNNSEKHLMFKSLFDRYVEIQVKLSEVSTHQKSVSATLSSNICGFPTETWPTRLRITG